jgi:Domain of unknown function (DUF4123)
MIPHANLAAAETWQQCVQALHRHLHQTAHSQCLLWVNPAQTDLFENYAAVQKRRIRVPIRHPRFDRQFAPYLVPLDLSKNADDEVFQRSVQAAHEAWALPSLQAHSGQPVGGWIVANASPQNLATYWADQVHVHIVGALTKLLRFHDPGVREWLWPAFSMHQQAQLLGPAEQLIGINRRQRLMIHTRPDGAAAVESVTRTQLRLSKPQWLEVDDYAIVHEAWLAQCSVADDETDQPHPFSRWRDQLLANWQTGVFKALQQASRYGIADPQDRVLFARHALQLGPEFHSHPSLQDVWQQTREGSFYGGAFEAVTAQPASQLHQYLSPPIS